MNLQRYTSRLERFWYGKGSRLSFPVQEVLSLASGGWTAAISIHDMFARPRRVAPFTVGISSLTVGGGGKTPLARWLADRLADRNLRPAIVSRGYGGRIHTPVQVRSGIHTADQVGDEPLFLSRRLPESIPVVVSKNRYKGCVFAHTHFHPDCLILDDTIMQTSIILDTEILVQGSDGGIGNGKCIPAGPLRKPVDTIRRMQGIVLIGETSSDMTITESIPFQTYSLPIFNARLIPGGIRNADGNTVPLSFIKNRRVGAWAGMARPWRFKKLLHRLGAEVVFYRSYTDHHVYTRDEVEALRKTVEELNLLPITTEKDIVRFPSDSDLRPYVLDIELDFQNPDELITLVTDAIGRS